MFSHCYELLEQQSEEQVTTFGGSATEPVESLDSLLAPVDEAAAAGAADLAAAELTGFLVNHPISTNTL